MNVNDVLSHLKSSNIKTEETLIEGFINEITAKYFPLYVLETFALNKEAQDIIKLFEDKKRQIETLNTDIKLHSIY